MKGSELFGQIIALLVLIGISFVAGGIILWVMNVTEDTDWGSTYSLTLNPIHQPVKYEVMMMSYMEITEDSVPIKKIILNAIENHDESTSLSEVSVDGEIFNLRSITSSIFNSWFSKQPYLFMVEIDDEVYRLAGSSVSFVGTGDNKISVKALKIPIKTSTRTGELILYVKD